MEVSAGSDSSIGVEDVCVDEGDERKEDKSGKRDKKDKKVKKDKKNKKDKKDKKGKKRRRHDSDSESEPLTEVESGKEFTTAIQEGKTKIAKSDFFAAITATEARKLPVGTFHSKGGGNTASADDVRGGSGDWKCLKCSSINMRNAPSCAKCRSYKRLGQ